VCLFVDADVSRLLLAFRFQLLGLFHADGSSFIGDSTYSVVLLLGAADAGGGAIGFFEYFFFSDDIVGIDFESLIGKETVELALECVHGGSTFVLMLESCPFVGFDKTRET
jgi:hypothetical protein